MKRIFVLSFFLILTFGCNNHSKVDDDIMCKTYVDILIAQETYLPNYDSLNLHKSLIFKKYGIDSSDYYYTLNSYKDDEETWENFFNNSLAYLDTLKKHNLK